MSDEEYLEWYDEGRRGEWVDGEVIEFMPPKIAHQLAIRFLFHVLREYVERFDLGVVLVHPCELWLASQRASRQPDLVFDARAHLDRITEDRVDGPADLVIEIISQDSAARDVREKFKEYAVAGIPDYWIFESHPGRYPDSGSNRPGCGMSPCQRSAC
jgi:Uma2 family endonuclease